MFTVDAGLVDVNGQRMVRRASAANDLEPEAVMLLEALPADGSSVGNYSLRSQLDLDDETYTKAKRELRDHNLITVGVGYGGTIARSTVEADATEAPETSRVVSKESELYKPFRDWLKSSLADQLINFYEVQVTATAKGFKKGGGKWSRPDITAVQVLKYDLLPEIAVEISTYEIKRAVDAGKLESVYEAAAHGRWAHRVSLVIEKAEEMFVIAQPILDEVRRFRLGLYTMYRRTDGKFEVKEIIKPALTMDAQPENLSDLLKYFFQNADLRVSQRYREAIGKG